MSVEICFYCLALAATSAFGSATSGTTFVGSCPWATTEMKCTAYIISQQMNTITISEKDGETYFETRTFRAGPLSPIEFLLGPLFYQVVWNACIPTITHPVWIFHSTTPFQVTVYSLAVGVGGHLNSISSFWLTPKSNCFTSYYTVTATGYPFILIYSFGFLKTNIVVSFPQTKVYFNLPCYANKKCAPGEKVFFQMSKYSSWYFVVDDGVASLRNVKVTSDNPIHVISGSVKGKVGLYKNPSSDTAITSLKPSTSWGKVYIVPAIKNRPLVFSISIMEAPLTIWFYEYTWNTKKTKNLTVDSQIVDEYVYGKTEHTFAALADSPFGFYQLFNSIAGSEVSKISSFGDVSILNLIPVELWKRGNVYLNVIPDIYAVKGFLVARGSHKDIVVSPAMHELKWPHPEIMVNGEYYCVAEIYLAKHNTKIYVNNTRGGVMLYLSVQLAKTTHVGHASYPYDYYLSKIYEKDCKVSKTTAPSDGEDNDCDGVVDEEVKNGKDDDLDGLIDEDYTEMLSDGKWSHWTYICKQLCNKTEISVNVRECLHRSTFGKDCEGESIECDKGPCPRKCVTPNTSQRHCFCNAGCSSCDKSIFICDDCQPGYQNFGHHCLKSCPSGNFDHCEMVETKKYILPVIIISAVCVFFFAMLALRIPTRKNSDSNDTGDSSSTKAPDKEMKSYIRKHGLALSEAETKTTQSDSD